MFGNTIVFASCSRLRLLIWNLGFLFVDHNSKFLGRILIFLEIKSRVWVLIKHYSCLVVSCFLFRFLFLLCVWISVFNLVRPHCKKKKGFTRSLPHRNVTLNKPSLQKKKFCSKKKKSVSLCSLLFVNILYWIFFSCVSFVFRICNCVRLTWICFGFRFCVI